MITYTAAFMTAMVLCLLTTPVMRWIALRIGAVSQVGGRNINTEEMPRLGGVAIAGSSILPLLVLFVLQSEVARLVRLQQTRVVGLVVGAVLMCAVGALDDVRGVSARTKLAFQVGMAVLAYYTGFQIPLLTIPGWGVLSVGYLALPLTVIWIVGVTNAVNLIDGLDGLAAGVVFCAAATNLIIAAMGESVLMAVVMASLMGGLFGFLFYNFNPARIFMGDSGSYFAGYVLATASLAGNQKASTAVSLLVPILALGLPIFDTLLSIVRRALLRRPLFSPDRGHIHHKLLDLGLTHRRAVLVLYGFSFLFAVSAVVVSFERNWSTGAAILLAAVLIAGLLRMSISVTQQMMSMPPGAFPLTGRTSIRPPPLDPSNEPVRVPVDPPEQRRG